VVKSPLFQLTAEVQTTAEEWAVQRAHIGPHADFETDLFLMNVPTKWIYAKTFVQMDELMKGYDKAMVGTSLFMGKPPDSRNRHVLYLQPDLHIKHGAYGTCSSLIVFDCLVIDGGCNNWTSRLLASSQCMCDLITFLSGGVCTLTNHAFHRCRDWVSTSERELEGTLFCVSL
jgi:hypothetical protein